MTKFKSPQLVTALALFMLIVAVQVSTDSAGEWIFIGLDLIELTNDSSFNLPSIADVALITSDDISQILLSILHCLAD
ncbi:hypothetical protein JK628_17730 [Shewanella sp. KX20019]|uniref:hypothetical protein n=1 Tax=Shewanella sp. KX20019 TaxID=2803864 RepID=UPI00192746B2|nr:hypothetical protein [Shewanella sp. KX20019]QQX79358.1 hypothetical protein JK628_17730 [Shewanella sp. KX20019]